MIYNEVIASLVTPEAFAQYCLSDVGTKERLSQLQGLTIEDIFLDGYEDTDMASCCLSGLWMLHNFLHQAHEICQDLPTPAGSHWHAIMHRIEGDFPNAKYWYRQSNAARWHADISELAGVAFEPNSLVDAIAEGQIEQTHEMVVAEWQGLFNHCYRCAAGDGLLE